MLPLYFLMTALEIEDKGSQTYDHNPTCPCRLSVFYCANSTGKKKSLALYPISFPFEFPSLEFKGNSDEEWAHIYLSAVYISSWSINVLTKKRLFLEQFDK